MDARRLIRCGLGLVCLAAMLTIATDANAQCRVQGVVKLGSGATLAGATVRIDGPDYRQPQTTTTDGEGRYVFTNVKPGIRVRIVALQGTRPIAQGFTLVTLWIETLDLVEQPIAVDASSEEFVLATEGPSGAVAGFVRSADGAPIAGARVTLGDTNIATTTDASGRYAIRRLRPGVTVDVHASASGAQSTSAPLTVVEHERQELNFTLTEQVSPSAVGAIDANRAAMDDAWLGAADDPAPVAVEDGFHLYHAGEIGSPLSAYNTAAARAASPNRAPSGFVDVSVFGLNTAVDVPVGDRFSILTAVRRSPPTSLYDDVLNRFAETSGSAVRDRTLRYSGGIFSGIPSASEFRDTNVSLRGSLTSRDRLAVAFYDGRARTNRSHDLALDQPAAGIGVPTAVLPSDALVQVSQASDWSSRGISGRWTRQWSPTASTNVSLARSRYSRSADQAWMVTGATSGSDYSFADSRGGSAGLTESNRVEETTFKADSIVGLGFTHILSAGAEASSYDIAYGSQTEAFRTMAAGTQTSSLVGLLTSDGTGTLARAYVQDAWRPSAPLTVTPGVRVGRYTPTGSALFEPRLEASYELLPGLRVNGAASVDHQVANRIEREDRLHGDGALWLLSDGSRVPIVRIRQAQLGATFDVQDVSIRIDAYEKRLDDVTLFAPRLFPGIAPAADATRLYTGSTTARGLEMALQHKNPRNTFSASYRLARATDSFPTLEANQFASSFDRRHAFTVIERAQIVAGWTLSGMFVAASGRPYTPPIALERVWFPTGATVNEATFGSKNSARLTPYNRLDASTERIWNLHGVKLAIGVTAFNVYDRQNVLSYEFETAGGTITPYDVPLVGRAFNGFVRVGF